MSRDGDVLARSHTLRWRQAKGHAFAVLSAASLAAGVLVVMVLVFITLRESLRIRAMHATAEAGLALSLRSMTAGDEEGGRTFPTIGIAQVTPGSRAAALGLQQGDALIRVAGAPVEEVGEVWRLVEERVDGEGDVAISWVPKLEALFGELAPVPVPGTVGIYRARVERVAPGSPAAVAGLEDSDLLLAAGGIPITGTQQAWQAVVIAARRGGGEVPLTVERGGEIVTLRLAAARAGELAMSVSLPRAMAAFVTRLDEPRYPEHAGLASAIVGSLAVLLVTALVAFPLGAAAAVYLEEYARRNVLTETIQVLIANLAGIPSVVYGIIGLEILARSAGLGRSIVAGGLTLALLILPVMIIASREALRAVPPWVREAAYGVGATQWQVVRYQVLPYSLPGMLTAMILSLSRAIGEAAPLILLGAFLYVTYLPKHLMDTFTVVPLQIFSWATRPQAGYDTIAAAAIVVLLAMLLVLNAAAIFLRNRFQQRW